MFDQEYNLDYENDQQTFGDWVESWGMGKTANRGEFRVSTKPKKKQSWREPETTYEEKEEEEEDFARNGDDGAYNNYAALYDWENTRNKSRGIPGAKHN